MTKFSENWKEIDWKPLELWGQTAKPKRPASAGFFLPDIQEFVSPLDKSVISSRSQLRDHERRWGVRQCGELKTSGDFDNNRDPYRYSERKLDEALRRAANRIPD